MNTTNETEVSADSVAITRKNAARIQSEILQRLAEVTQSRAAQCMGVDASKVSRMKDDLDAVSLLLSALGLEIAPMDAMVVPREDLAAYERLAFQYLKQKVEGRP